MKYKFKKNFNTHGGNTYAFSESIIDFSANISPLGIPIAVKTNIINSLDSCDRYPDINCTKLCNKLGEYYSLPAKSFYIGNGAGDIIFRFAKAINIKKALIIAPTFSEYSLACSLENAQIVNYFLNEEDGFIIKSDIVDYIDKETDAVFICSPNNPTGKITDKTLLIKILEKCNQTGTLLFLDECFLDFTGDEKELSCISITSQFKNLVILKAFTKIYAMAGIRLGFGVTSNVNLILNMKNCGQPWNVSTVAQVAGICALEQEDYKNKVITLVRTESEFLTNGLINLGFKIYSPTANYILFKNTKSKTDLKLELLKYGILIRSCENYIGLDKSFYRVAIKTHKDNKKLLECLKNVVN